MGSRILILTFTFHFAEHLNRLENKKSILEFEAENFTLKICEF